MTRNTVDPAVSTEQRLRAAADRNDNIGAIAAVVGVPLPLVRVSAGMLEDQSCPRSRWAKANVSFSVQRPRRRRERWNDFLLDPLLKVLDSIEADGLPLSEALDPVRRDARFGEAEKRWIENAVSLYPDFLTDGLRPVRGSWVVRGSAGGQMRELYAWGRAYESEDGQHRLHVLPVMATAGRREASRTKTSVAAYTAAYGELASWPDPWPTPFRIAQDQRTEPARVTVRQVGLLDGSVRDVFDGTPEEAKDLYEATARPVASAITSNIEMGPGRNCDGCRLLDECDSVPRVPGLLGVSDSTAPLRSLSATTLRYHGACPQQARLFDLKLSTVREETSVVRVGRAVDEVLNRAHGAGRVAPCTGLELRSLLDGISDLTSEERRRSGELLEGHEQTCPWAAAGVDLDDVVPQAEVVAFDPEASVVIHAAPDLLFREDRAVVWRETTTSERLPWNSLAPFDTFKSVQLALAVLLMSHGVGGREFARIEVEYLTDEGPDLRFLDPNDSELVAEAAAIIRPLATSWRGDQDFVATPGPPCRSCAYTAWCPVSVRGEVE